jgi:hypothetical protein
MVYPADGKHPAYLQRSKAWKNPELTFLHRVSISLAPSEGWITGDINEESYSSSDFDRLFHRGRIRSGRRKSIGTPTQFHGDGRRIPRDDQDRRSYRQAHDEKGPHEEEKTYEKGHVTFNVKRFANEKPPKGGFSVAGAFSWEPPLFAPD